MCPSAVDGTCADFLPEEDRLRMRFWHTNSRAIVEKRCLARTSQRKAVQVDWPIDRRSWHYTMSSFSMSVNRSCARDRLHPIGLRKCDSERLNDDASRLKSVFCTFERLEGHAKVRCTFVCCPREGWGRRVRSSGGETFSSISSVTIDLIRHFASGIYIRMP